MTMAFKHTFGFNLTLNVKMLLAVLTWEYIKLFVVTDISRHLTQQQENGFKDPAAKKENKLIQKNKYLKTNCTHYLTLFKTLTKSTI